MNEQTIAAFVAMHDATAQAEQMVYEVWEDGEVTLTKGGSLYGQRSLHSVWLPQYHMVKTPVLLPVERMPKQNYNKEHGCIQLKHGFQVNAALELLFGKCHYTSKWYL